METLSVAGIIAAILGVVYYMTQRSKADAVVAELEVRPTKEDIAEVKEIARLEQEIKDGKIDYASSRARLNELRTRKDDSSIH